MSVGIILSGGMAKGAYQIGALKAISNYFTPDDISGISCASVGVLNGYAFMTGELSKAEYMWKTICDNNNRILINSLLRSALLQEKINDIYNPEKHINKPFYCALADFYGKNIVYKNLLEVEEKNTELYLKASVAMPLYNKAVEIEGKKYFDGAILDNIPVFPLYKENMDYYICIYFDNISYKFENIAFDNHIIKIFFPSDSIIRRSLIFRREGIENMINDGYDMTSYILDSAFANGTNDIDKVYSKIKTLNKYTEKSKMRITGDMLVTNINKAAKRFFNKQI